MENTINFCTLCDKNYLHKALALYSSLKSTVKKPFRLFWLCIDNETFTILSKLKIENVIPIELSLLEKVDIDLQKSKDNPPSKYGSQRDNYIWSLTPYFINYLLDERRKYIPEGEKLTYVDSDILFYQSPEVILDIIGNRPIGIHTHRFGRRIKSKESPAGWYNVGVVVLTNNPVGMHVSNLWKYWTMNQTHEYYERYGTCGDQKYLELFEHVAGGDNVCVFDEDEHTRISHRAPWCIEEDNLPVVFYHFSHFTFDLQKNTWSDSLRGEWKPADNAHIRPFYEGYFEEIKKSEALIQSVRELV